MMKVIIDLKIKQKQKNKLNELKFYYRSFTAKINTQIRF